MKSIFVIIFCILLSSCVNNSVYRVDSPSDLKKIKSILVKKLPADKRGIDRLIVNKLISMGFQATTEESDQLQNIDAIITYRDKWRWDMSMYMLSLSLKVREPDTEFPIASGNSLHTSLTRKTPNEMVGEVLTKIFYSVGAP